MRVKLLLLISFTLSIKGINTLHPGVAFRLEQQAGNARETIKGNLCCEAAIVL